MIKKLSRTRLATLAAICAIVSTLICFSGVKIAKAAENTNVDVVSVVWQTNNMLTFKLSHTDYDGLATHKVGSRYSEYNFAENITFYTDYYATTPAKGINDCIRGTSGKFTEIYYNMWGRVDTFSVSLEANKFWVGDNAVKRIEIAAGTQFPSYAYTGAAAFGTEDYSTPASDQKTSFVTTSKIVFLLDGAGEFVEQSKWDEPEEFTEYKGGVKYDVNSQFIVKHSKAPQGYGSLKFIPFNSFSDFATEHMGDSGKCIHAGTNMEVDSYMELEFVHEIDSSVFDKITIGFAGHNISGSKELTFSAYNAYKLKKDQSEQAVQKFSVKFWKVGTTSFKLSDYADENGMVKKIVFRLTSAYIEQQVFVTDFSLTEEIPFEMVAGSVPEKMHIRGWLNDPVTGEPLPLLNRNDAHCMLIFFLSEVVCDEVEYVSVNGSLVKKSIAMDADRLYDYNTLDNVLLTVIISEDTESYNGTNNGDGTKTITLREAFEWNGWEGAYTGKEAYYTIFGEGGNAVGYEIGNLLGTDVVKVTILKGCQFPYYEYTNNIAATKKKALVQVETMDFIDTAPHQTFAIGWEPQIKKGDTSISDVSYNLSGNDNILSFTLSSSDYENAAADTACGLEKAFPKDECYKNILINGKTLYSYFENYDEEIKSVINRNGKTGTFSLNIPGLSATDAITSVVIKSGCKIPAYANSKDSIKAYGVCYYQTQDVVAFNLNPATGKLEKAQVMWKVTFDGKNEILVGNGECISEEDYPKASQKAGEIFVGWFDGDNMWRSGNVVTGDMNLVSVFEKTITVTFDSLGGSKIQAQTIIYGGWIDYPADPEKANEKFLGWYKNRECTQEFDRYEELTEDITLYAKWAGKVSNSESSSGCGSAINANFAFIFMAAATGFFLCLNIKKRHNNI